jgi:hypothetical protein
MIFGWRQFDVSRRHTFLQLPLLLSFFIDQTIQLHSTPPITGSQNISRQNAMVGSIGSVIVSGIVLH